MTAERAEATERSRARTLAGEVAIVTGGGSGIGRASALLFAQCGAAVVVADLASDAGEATVAEIVSAGGRARFVRADVTLESDVAEIVAAAVEDYGRLDIAFNNAGTAAPRALTAQMDTEAWDVCIATNLRSVFLCMKHELAAMVPNGRGAIVNTSSVAGVTGLGGAAAYAAAKHGIVGLTRSAAAEYGSHGIRVNAVAPGMTRTGMTKGFIDGERVAAMVATLPLRRVAQAHEIAEAVLWLASPMASFVTGHILSADGGETAAT